MCNSMVAARGLMAGLLFLSATACGESPAGPGPVGGGAAASVATIDSIRIPEVGLDPRTGWTADLLNVWTTNEAVYLKTQLIGSTLADSKTKVFRRRGGVRVGTWQSMELPQFAPSIRPVRRDNEGSETFSVYWVGDNDFGDRQWGMANMGTGTASFTYLNTSEDFTVDLSLYTVFPDQSSTARTWAVDLDGRVLRESASQGGDPRVMRFDTITSPLGLTSGYGLYPVRGIGTASGVLYWGTANKLHVVTSSGLQTTYDLSPFGAGHVNRILETSGTIWVGYGDKVLSFTPGSAPSQFASTGISGDLFGSFCVQRGGVYLNDGTRIDLNSGARQSFLQNKDTLTPEQQVQVAKARVHLRLGMHCLENSTGYTIYSVTPTHLFQIEPVPVY